MVGKHGEIASESTLSRRGKYLPANSMRTNSGAAQTCPRLHSGRGDPSVSRWVNKIEIGDTVADIALGGIEDLLVAGVMHRSKPGRERCAPPIRPKMEGPRRPRVRHAFLLNPVKPGHDHGLTAHSNCDPQAKPAALPVSLRSFRVAPWSRRALAGSLILIHRKGEPSGSSSKGGPGWRQASKNGWIAPN